MEDGRWVTINGAHVFVKDGQSPMDAFIRNKGKDDKIIGEIETDLYNQVFEDNNFHYTLENYNAENIKKSNVFDNDINDKINRIAFDKGYEITKDEVDDIKEKFYKEYDKKRNKLLNQNNNIDIEKYKNEHGGYTPQQIQEMIDYQNKNRNKNKEQREITSSTYKRAQSKLQKNVNSWFGRGF